MFVIIGDTVNERAGTGKGKRVGHFNLFGECVFRAMAIRDGQGDRVGCRGGVATLVAVFAAAGVVEESSAVVDKQRGRTGAWGVQYIQTVLPEVPGVVNDIAVGRGGVEADAERNAVVLLVGERCRYGFNDDPGAVRRVGEVGQVTGRGTHQRHQHDGIARRDEQAPLAAAVPESHVLQLSGGEGFRLVAPQGDADCVVAFGIAVVIAADGDRGHGIRGVDDSQAALPVGVTARVEYGYLVLSSRSVHDIVERGEKAVRGAHVGEHLYVQIAGDRQPPVAGAAADALDAFVGVAVLQVVGVEVQRLIGADGEGERARAVSGARVVRGVYRHGSRFR